MLSCRYLMLQKSILNEPKWGAQAVVRGRPCPWPHRSDNTPGPIVATTLAISAKNDSPVANFVNSQEKTTKPYFEPGLQIRT